MTELFLPQQDPILNPPYCASLYARLAGGASRTVLPAAPLGHVWAVLNANVLTLVGAGGAISIREEVPGEPVRVMDLRTGMPANVAQLQSGGLYTKGPLVFQNTGAQPVVYGATALALPVSLAQRVWMSLTNVFQPMAYVAPDANHVLRVPYAILAASGAFWANNTDIAARTVEFQFTRGTETYTIQATATSANARSSLTVSAGAWPPLQSGDVLEARVTAAPASPVYIGGLLQTVPRLGLG